MRPSNDPQFRSSGDLLIVVQPEGAGIEADEATDLDWSMHVIKELDKHYPGHPWIVSFQGGALIVRHVDIAHAVTMKTGKSGFGSVLPPHRGGSLKEILPSAVRFAGELLEAFQMPRGRYNPHEYPAICPDWPRGKRANFT